MLDTTQSHAPGPPQEQSPALSDEQVIDRVLTGETALFEVLMRRHNRRVYRAVRALIQDTAEVEDVMQQAYLSAYTHLDQFAKMARFATWLIRIAVHEALAHLRRRGHLVELKDGDDQGETLKYQSDDMRDPEEGAGMHELIGLLEEAVDGLPPIYRCVFMLREVEGLNTAEVATCLELGEDLVKVRLHRARALLRAELHRRVGPGAADAFSFGGPRCDRVVAAVMDRLAGLSTARHFPA